MPEIVIYAAEGRSAEQKKGLITDFTAAMCKNFGVPADAVTITIMETPKHLKAKGGVLFSEMGKK
jgi:4-oxalocrotonate tautomerase